MVYDAHDMDFFHDMEGNFTLAKALNEDYVNTNMKSSVISGSTIDGKYYHYHTSIGFVIFLIQLVTNCNILFLL